MPYFNPGQNTEYDILREKDFEDLIADFAQRKDRKMSVRVLIGSNT